MGKMHLMQEPLPSPFTLRPEKAAERAGIATLLARAYGGVAVQVIELISNLRRLPTYKPELACVGVTDRKLSAYALFTPVTVGGQPHAALLLAPVAMDPTVVGNLAPSVWLQQILSHVARQGFRYVLVQGDPKVYLPEGFVPASNLGVTGHTAPVGELLLVKDLHPGRPPSLSGAIEYPA